MSTNIDQILRQQDASSSLPQARFMQNVYAWMFGGLLVTAVSAYATLSMELVAEFAYRFTFILLLAELGLVMWLSSAISRLSETQARIMFLVYSALNGLTLALVLFRYTGESVTNVFVSSAAMFGAMSAYGYMTKRDLTSVGSFFSMGLIGLLVAMVVNVFLQSSALSFAISIIGVVVFVALTAYDTQKIKEAYAIAESGDRLASNIAILGALTLYLDFINLFLFLLRLFGRKR